MPPASQPGRPKLNKHSSSSLSYQGANKNIRDFFKPAAIPKNRIPANDVVEDEIVVVARERRPSVAASLAPSVKSSSGVNQRGKGSKTSSGASTPTQPRRSPVKAKRASQLDGADAGESLHHESPSNSQQRVMTAVEIPAPTKPRPQTTDSDANMANTSFNSFSSLTSLGLSSQASSSRRIVKDGVPAVTNSDSGSDQDSDEELLDIPTKPRKRMKMTPPPGGAAETAFEVPSTVKPPARQSGRLSGKKSLGSSRANTPARRRSPEPPRPANSSALMRLVREKEAREKAEARIRDAEAAFEDEQRVREEKLQRQRDLGGGLKALVADDSDEGERMMLAMERTEAMGEEGDFFYFRGVREDLDVKEPAPSDVAAFALWYGTKFDRLKKMVLDPVAREQACLTGFLAEVAARHRLPPCIQDWLLERLVQEPREELREAYAAVLRRCSEGDNILREPFPSLKRLYVTQDPNTSEARRESRDAQSNRQILGLRHVVSIISHSCDGWATSQFKESISELALANIDQRVSGDANLRGEVREGLVRVITRLQASREADEDPALLVWTEGIRTLGLPLPLLCRLIVSLPACNPVCHDFRRTLALYAVVEHETGKKPSQKQVTSDTKTTDWPTRLLTHLRTSPSWAIAESTDYNALNALIPVLDIALDAGFPLSTNTTCSPEQDEKQFNAQIDSFVDALRALSSRIRDAGTSHLRRTEAKSALERVIVRLEWCVRTRPRARKGVFGGAGEGRAGFMSGFLKKKGPAEESEVDGAVEKSVGKDRRVKIENEKLEGMGLIWRMQQERKERGSEDRVVVLPEDNELSERVGDGDAEVGGDARGGAEDGDDAVEVAAAMQSGHQT